MASKISKEQFLKTFERFYDDKPRPGSELIQEFISLDDLDDRIAIRRRLESSIRSTYHDNSIRLPTPVYSALLSKPFAEPEQFVQFISPLVTCRRQRISQWLEETEPDECTMNIR